METQPDEMHDLQQSDEADEESTQQRMHAQQQQNAGDAAAEFLQRAESSSAAAGAAGSSGAMQQRQHEQGAEQQQQRATHEKRDDAPAAKDFTRHAVNTSSMNFSQCSPCEDDSPVHTRRTDRDLVFTERAREMLESQLGCQRTLMADDGRQRHRRRKRGEG